MPIKPLKLFLHTILAILLSSCASVPSEKIVSGKLAIEHIVLISIDGLRPDAINMDNASNLYQLTQTGLYYPKASTIQRSVTLPGHISLLTGLDSKQHHITENNLLPGYLDFPTILQIVKSQGHKTAALYAKTKLGFLFPPDSVDYIYGPGQNDIDYHHTDANGLATEFVRVWSKQAYRLTFIHIREPDRYGHKYGWMSDEYLNQSVPLADQAIGKIVNTIKSSPQAATTLLIITADHGGKDKKHWYHRPEDLTIPWIASHPQLAPETLTNTQVTIYDTAPTILHLLGAPIPDGLDGHIIERFQRK